MANLSSDLRIMGAREFETTNPMLLPATAESLGPDHAPTPHKQSALAMIQAIEDNGLQLDSQIHVVDGVRTIGNRGGNYGDVTIPEAHLFSLYRVSYDGLSDLLIGYRNSVAQTMARRACVGKSFPICSNVSLFGDDIVFSKKNTIGQTNIRQIAYEGVRDKVLPAFRTIEEQLDNLRGSTLGNNRRRAMTLSAFEQKVLPAALIPEMRDLWANETMSDDAPEVYEDRFNQLGLMQSMTRVTRDLPTRRQALASQKISRFFGFGLAA